MSEEDKTKEETSNVEEVNLTIPFTESFVYSNVSAYSASPMDFRISFGEAMPDRTVVPKVGIVMPPEHAAQLAMNLLQHLHVFERSFGQIRNPDWREFQDKAKANLLRGQAKQSEEPPASE